MGWTNGMSGACLGGPAVVRSSGLTPVRRLPSDLRRSFLFGRAVLYSAADPRDIRAACPWAAPGTKETTSLSVIDEIAAEQLRTDLPELASGDTVKVHARVREGNRERIQVFEGTVMRLRGGGINRSITVRSIRSGVGVERTFKVNSPRIDRIEVLRHGVARRAQLYFLRKRVGKAASLRERRPT